jgi:hypothetical protein
MGTSGVGSRYHTTASEHLEDVCAIVMFVVCKSVIVLVICSFVPRVFSKSDYQPNPIYSESRDRQYEC